LSTPSEKWCQRASTFVQRSHQYLLHHPYLLNQGRNKGLTQQSIIDFHLGWNTVDVFEQRQLWGLPDLSSEGGSSSLCLPSGVVIPSFRDNCLIREKIRRHNWKSEDQFPKYQILSGGIASPGIYGKVGKPVVLVEAELDAILVQQLAADLCCCISLGGVSNRPDEIADRILRQASCILYALDFDEAGKKAFYFWKSTTKQQFGYCYNPISSNGDFYRFRSEWGLPGTQNDKGNLAKLWLPAGIVIPFHSVAEEVL
jgi:DNA primase